MKIKLFQLIALLFISFTNSIILTSQVGHSGGGMSKTEVLQYTLLDNISNQHISPHNKKESITSLLATLDTAAVVVISGNNGTRLDIIRAKDFLNQLKFNVYGNPSEFIIHVKSPKTITLQFHSPVDRNTDTTKYALVCINNPTNSTINYDFKWGKNNWSSIRLTENSSYLHWWPYPDKSKEVPKLRIKYDRLIGNGIIKADSYILEKYIAKKIDCNQGKQYSFDLNNNDFLDIFLDEKN